MIVSYLVVIFNLFLGCRPYHLYWQISPNPGSTLDRKHLIVVRTDADMKLADVCQPAVSNQIVWVYYTFNVITDIYLLTIPLPMLWISTMKIWRKIGLMFLFGGGMLVIVCATVRCVIIVTVRC